MIPITINDVDIDCINRAAITYHVSVPIILSVMKKENGRNGLAVLNKKNGTHDYGVMQINDVWLPKILPYGYTKHDIQYDACKNVMVGTWILSQSIAYGKNLWSGIGNYHSHTPDHNRNYRNDIYKNYSKINYILNT